MSFGLHSRTAQAVLTRIDELEAEKRIENPHAEALRNYYAQRRDLEASLADDASHAARYRDIKSELIAAQREALTALRESGEIDNVVMRRVQADLDYYEAGRSGLIE
ncbi:MAG: hypothetical protein ACLPYS_13325 [Vulcanimicrobiaceae bacterium]